MILSGIFMFLASGSLALGLTPIVRELARQRSGKALQIPRLGGTAIFAAFCLPLLFIALFSRAVWLDRRLLIVIAGSLLVLAIGVFDDIRGASIWSRLAVEITAACLVYSAGIRIVTLPNPFGASLNLGWLSLPATVLWVIVITNAINLIDGLDGLAAGSAILILATVLLLNWNLWHGIQFLATFSLLGALAGFLAYNFPPATIFMGDSGSLFLGFFLSSFAIAAPSGAPGSKIVWITALAFSLPLLDMAYAVLRRWYRGVHIYTADKDHLHHKLLDKGISKKKILLFFYGANLILLLALVLLVQVNLRPLPMFLILLLLSMAAFAGLQFLSELKPVEFVRKIFVLFRVFRRRRYCSYLINRFERSIEKKKQLSDIRIHLDELFQDYGFSAVEIRIEGTGRPGLAYLFGNRREPEDALRVEFSLRREGGGHGRVILHMQLGSEHVLCIGELADILSEYLSKISLS